MTRDIELIQPPKPRNRLHHSVGLGLLALNAVRHRIRGYRTPRPWFSHNASQLLEYDRAVFRNWNHYLEKYLQFDLDLRDRSVVEIGPGSDLGTGLLWLAAGACSYAAIDAHPLITGKTRDTHQELARLIAGADIDLLDRLLDAVEKLHAGEEGALRYRVLPNFDLERLDLEGFDLVVSHSALEHVARIPETFAALSKRVSDRAHLVAEIDLQTHTRWIRDRDPLNIYRYRAGVWNSFRFSGSPNRVRPDAYFECLEQYGWKDFRVWPTRVLPAEYVQSVSPSLAPRFRGDPEQLAWLSLVICASREGERSWLKPLKAEEELPAGVAS